MEKFALDAEVSESAANDTGPKRTLEGTSLEELYAQDDEAPGWARRRPRPTSVDPMPHLAATCRDYAAQVPLPTMGRGAERELRQRIERALTWARRHYDPDRGSFTDFAQAVVLVAGKRFFTQITPRRRQAELDDQTLRDQLCAEGDAGLARYIATVEEQLRKKQRFGSCRLPNEREKDLIAETVVKIVEIVRRDAQPFPFAAYERAGVPTYVVIFDEVRAAARRHRRLTLVGTPLDLPTATFPSAEEVILAKEYRDALDALPRKLAERLSATQCRWLEAFQEAAAEEGDLSLALAAARRGLHRAQATRAAARIAAVARRYNLVADLIEPPAEGPTRHVPRPDQRHRPDRESVSGGVTNVNPTQVYAVSTFRPASSDCEHDRDWPDLPCFQCRHEAAEVGRYRNRKHLDRDFRPRPSRSSPRSEPSRHDSDYDAAVRHLDGRESH